MNVEPEFVVRFIKIIGKLICTWPLNPSLKSSVNKIKELFWFISFFNVIGLLVPLILGVHHYLKKDPILMMKSLSELTALVDIFFNLILCKVNQIEFHDLLSELLNYVHSVKGEERILFQKNVNHYFKFWAFVALSYFQTAIAFSCGPFFMKQILPADTWYPFTVEIFSVQYYIIYAQQVLVILQTGMGITVDFMVAMLLCYSSTKLEMLNSELKTVETSKELNTCICKHQNCIQFVEKLTNAVRFIILKSNATMAMAVIFGAFPIITHEPLPVVSQFILMVVAGCLRLYVTAWPANDVYEMSQCIALSIYTSHWYKKSQRMQKSVLLVIYRAQKPLVISIKGILPALTLKYYAAFLSSTLSYFMTLRAVVEK